MPTLAAQRMYPAMKEDFGDQSVPQGTIQRGRQCCAGSYRGEVDQCPRRSGHRESEGGLTVEQIKLLGRVDDHTNPANVAITGRDQVIRQR